MVQGPESLGHKRFSVQDSGDPSNIKGSGDRAPVDTCPLEIRGSVIQKTDGRDMKGVRVNKKLMIDTHKEGIGVVKKKHTRMRQVKLSNLHHTWQI